MFSFRNWKLLSNFLEFYELLFISLIIQFIRIFSNNSITCFFFSSECYVIVCVNLFFNCFVFLGLLFNSLFFLLFTIYFISLLIFNILKLISFISLDGSFMLFSTLIQFLIPNVMFLTFVYCFLELNFTVEIIFYSIKHNVQYFFLMCFEFSTNVSLNVFRNSVVFY